MHPLINSVDFQRYPMKIGFEQYFSGLGASFKFMTGDTPMMAVLHSRHPAFPAILTLLIRHKSYDNKFLYKPQECARMSQC